MDHIKIHQKEENCSEDDCRLDDIPVKIEPNDSGTETFTTLENAVPFPNTSDSSNSSSLISGPTINAPGGGTTTNVVPVNNFQVLAQPNQELRYYLIFTCQKCEQLFFNSSELDVHVCAPQASRSEIASSSIINAT